MIIGIIGIGTIGRGVLEILNKEKENSEKRIGETIEKY